MCIDVKSTIMHVTTCPGCCYNFPRTGASCNTLTHLIVNIGFLKYGTSKTNQNGLDICATYHVPGQVVTRRRASFNIGFLKYGTSKTNYYGLDINV